MKIIKAITAENINQQIDRMNVVFDAGEVNNISKLFSIVPNIYKQKFITLGLPFRFYEKFDFNNS